MLMVVLACYYEVGTVGIFSCFLCDAKVFSEVARWDFAQFKNGNPQVSVILWSLDMA